MPFEEKDGIRFFRFNTFSDSIVHAVFSRRGGISPAPWDSLNVGGMVGDDAARVLENRARSFKAVGRDLASMHDVWLVHGTNVVYADAPRLLDQPAIQADILLTDRPEVSLFMRFADCVPILFHDPLKKVVGISHAGWLGTLRGTAASAVRAMQDRYGCKPEHIIAGIGPSIGVDHYEVGPEVVDQFQEKYGEDTERIIDSRDGGSYLNLWMANSIQLTNAGVQQIEISGLCTACHLENWFSHRAEKGKTGRFGALIALQV